MKTYEPFDPFEVFQPSKAFVKEVIKHLREDSASLQQARAALPPWADWAKDELTARQNKLVARIKHYIFRLNLFEKSGRWDMPSQEGRITDRDIARAKEVPITNFYTGKLRRGGNRLYGRCPFHEEKSASFVIYPTNDFHCFGCNANGTVVDYIMKTQNLNFINSIKFLINKN